MFQNKFKILYEKAIKKGDLTLPNTVFLCNIQYSKIANEFSLFINNYITRYDINHYAILKTEKEYNKYLTYKFFKKYLIERSILIKKQKLKLDIYRFEWQLEHKKIIRINEAISKNKKDRTDFDNYLINYSFK